MTALTFRKGIAALCCFVGVVLILVGVHYVWVAPVEYGREGTISIVAGLVLQIIFWVLWP